MTRNTTVELKLNQRELKALIAAMKLARDQTTNTGWRWWNETLYADDLFWTLVGKVTHETGWYDGLTGAGLKGWRRA